MGFKKTIRRGENRATFEQREEAAFKSVTYRQNRNMSQTELANQIGTRQTTISFLEKGNDIVPSWVIFAVIEIYGNGDVL